MIPVPIRLSSGKTQGQQLAKALQTVADTSFVCGDLIAATGAMHACRVQAEVIDAFPGV